MGRIAAGGETGRYGLGVAVNRRGYCIGRCGQQITIFEL